MSRDQRPARPIMIAADATDDVPQRRAADIAAATGGTDTPAAAAAPATSRTLLLSVLFLFACVAGAVGVALAPWLLSGR